MPLSSNAGIAARVAAFTTILPGQDYVRLASEEEVDLILLDGRRPLLGEGVPKGAVGQVLEQAPCDVAVLVERKDMPTIDADHPVMVPFGGGDHDWAALELAAWIASVDRGAAEAPRRRPTAVAGDASRVLDSASLVVRQLAGIETEPVLVNLSNGGIVPATEGAGLLVVGLSERWKSEGLGPVRAAIAKAAPAPDPLRPPRNARRRAGAAHRRRDQVRVVARRPEPLGLRPSKSRPAAPKYEVSTRARPTRVGKRVPPATRRKRNAGSGARLCRL